jgi:acetate kinase
MATKSPSILTINGGSSSIKFALFETGGTPIRILRGQIERIGQPEAVFKVVSRDPANSFTQSVAAPDYADAVGTLVEWIADNGGGRGLLAVGHRVVHGGPKYHRPQSITEAMIDALSRYIPYDPEHLPAEILLIETLAREFPNLPQVACFDTAFHHDMPRVARMLPLPRRYEMQGLRRYGFHGLSYAFLMSELSQLPELPGMAGPEAAQGRIILAHLGNGASMAAVRQGRPVDTSMGFSPASGLVMGTRTGDMDPGVFCFLAESEDMSATRFQRLVSHESGLLGVSGSGSDMRDLLARAGGDERAAEAVELFCYQAKKCIGSYAAALGGLDTLVFSAGIGENCPAIRARICEGLGFLGLELDAAANEANLPVISAASGKVQVRVIKTDEEIMIARSVARILEERRMQEARP